MEQTSPFPLRFSILRADNGDARDRVVTPFQRGFELCTVAHSVEGLGVTRAYGSPGRSVLVKRPAIISSSDLKQVKAVTRRAWFVLSGSHSTSTLALKLKPEALARARTAIRQSVSFGDQVAILLNGEVVGVMVFQHSQEGIEITIDASFFSEGTEEEKACETRRLAQQINLTLS